MEDDISAVYHTRPRAGSGIRHAGDWIAALRKRRLQRRVKRELAELPPYLLRDVGLVDLMPPREDGGRTLDHTAVHTALFTYHW